ncbi:DNA-directed RNA polymerases IV and V subunit 4 [Elaeis guineensis]|uniref:DNA-directed RNA polymerases IV and V subunit 4 n=1 Tax=Elaeis guineensis var. tenera TaxID=51953 RepID=A0A6I9SHD9_ELAGV|nr:DNA-directed RNA polymerases IV and V subunit 4 [Elaeis guineensis]XP_010942906.1 DNA-directed RNA polymerases IV and V subunit 4 [Elaeis guineensis]
MAEKGGKNFSSEKGKTPSNLAASKEGSLKGKDSVPVNKTRHIQLDDSDSEYEGFVDERSPASSKASGKASSDLKSGKKKVSFESLKTGRKTSFETPAAKGDWGKGGKDFNAGKAGGKGSLPRATAVKPRLTEIELKLELELPKNARLLMDCEAAEILQEIEEHKTILSEDPKVKFPESFNKVLQYTKFGSHYINSQSARKVLETLKINGVNDGEICMIGNICPETVEEVYALLPSLKVNKHKNEEPIKEVLASLAKVKTSK